MKKKTSFDIENPLYIATDLEAKFKIIHESEVTATN